MVVDSVDMRGQEDEDEEEGRPASRVRCYLSPIEVARSQ